MAFFGTKLVNLLRNAAANRQHISSEIRSPSFFQAIRCKASSTPTTKLYVGGLSHLTNSDDLTKAFSRYGKVFLAIVVNYNLTRLRGHKPYGFVMYYFVEDATRALKAYNGKVLDGKRIKVQYSIDSIKWERFRNFSSLAPVEPGLHRLCKWRGGVATDSSTPGRLVTSSCIGSGMNNGTDGNFTIEGGTGNVGEAAGGVGIHESSAASASGSNAGFASSGFVGKALDGSG